MSRMEQMMDRRLVEAEGRVENMVGRRANLEGVGKGEQLVSEVARRRVEEVKGESACWWRRGTPSSSSSCPAIKM